MIRPFFIMMIGIVSGEIMMYLIKMPLILVPAILGFGCLFFMPKSFYWHGILFYGALLFGILIFAGASAKDSLDERLNLQEEEGSLRGTVTRVQKSKEDKLKITLTHTKFAAKEESFSLKKKCMVYLDIGNGKIFPKDKVRIRGTLTLPKEPTNPGQFHAKNYYRASGIYYIFFGEKLSSHIRPSFSLSRIAWKLKERIHSVYEKFLSEEQSALLYAMVLGDKSELSDEMKRLYEENGTAHLLAVSGLHISIVGGRIYRFLRKRKFSYFCSCLGGALVLLFYGCITGYGSSVLRAVLMFLIFLGAEYFGMYYDLLSSMSLSGILMLIEHPYRILEGGFLISYSSILAIGLVVPVVEKGMKDHRQKAVKQCITGMMITVSTVPMMMRIFYEFSPYSVILNLLMIPCMTVLMIFAILGGVCGCVVSVGGFFLLLPARAILYCFETLLRITDRLPGSLIVTGCPKMIVVIIFYFLEAFVLFLWYHKKRSAIIILLMSVLSAFFFLPEPKLRITMLDVGQGDGILLRLPEHTSILVDGGSTSENKVGEYIIEPALKYYGIGRLDYAVITHLDQDHYSGILTLMEEGFPIKNLLMQDWKLETSGEEVYERFVALAKKNHTKISYLGKGDSLLFSGGEIVCLHPFKELDIENKNDASVVLYFKYKRFSMLFTGDLGQGQEENVLRSFPGKNNLTVLKVGHHGSQNSTSEALLKKLNPEYGLISSGKNNRYGHPHEKLLLRLKKQGVKILRTEEGGAICLFTDGKKYKIGYWR